MKRYLQIVLAVLLIAVSCAPVPDSTERLALYGRAKSLYLQGSIEEAKPLFRKIYETYPEFHQAGLMYGKACMLSGDTGEAKKVFELLLQDHPGYPEAKLWQIRNLLNTGDAKEAGVLLNRALEKDSRDPRLLSLSGVIHETEKEYQQAIESYRKALLFEEELARTRLRLARLLFRFGLDREAALEIRKALAVLPEESILGKSVQEVLERIDGEGDR